MGGQGSGRKAQMVGFYNCREAAKFLNVTVNEIYRRVKEGALLPDKTDVAGSHFFSSNTLSLEKARAKREAHEWGEGHVFSADEAVGVYEGLKKGKSLPELVVELKAHPFAVEAAAKSWARLQGAIYVSKMTLDRIYKLPLEGHFPLTNGDELYEVLRLASKVQTCITCDHHPATECKLCIKKAVKKAENRGVMSERLRKASKEQPVDDDEPLDAPPKTSDQDVDEAEIEE